MDNIREILDERGSAYGNFKDQAIISQRMKTWARLTNFESLEYYEQEAIDMILHKIARIVNGGGGSKHKDSYIDIIGYSQLVLDLLEKEKDDSL